MPDSLWGGVWYDIITYWPLFLEGIKNTLLISLTGTVIGFTLSLVIAPMRLLKSTSRDSLLLKIVKKIVRILSTIYVEVLRGTPMIVQAMIIYYTIGRIHPALSWSSPIQCGIFVVSINTAAYISEILRGSIQAIDPGQTEAARSIGMTSTQTMIYVVLPQAIKNSIPAIGNEFVINIKDTSVLMVIAVTELFFSARSVAGIHYRTEEAYIVAAIAYLFMTFTATRVLYWLGKKLDPPVAKAKTKKKLKKLVRRV